MIEQQQRKSTSLFPRQEIKSILHKSNAKERALALANHVADLNMGEPTTLSPNEFENLVTSFQSSREIKIYNRIKEIDKCVRNVLPYLNQLRLIYHENVAYLWGCYNMAFTLDFCQETINNILNHSQKPVNTTKPGRLPQAVGNSQISLKYNQSNQVTIIINTEPGNESIAKSFMASDIKADENVLLNLIKFYKQRSEEGAIELKSCIAAVKHYLVKEEAEINIYWRKIREIEDNMRSGEGPLRLRNFFNKNTINENGYQFQYPVYDELNLNQKMFDEFSTKYLL
jgi:hypothetical protein